MPCARLRHPFALAALALGALFSHVAVQAQTLTPTETRNRWVMQYGYADVQGADGVVGAREEQFHEHYVSPDLVFGAYDAGDTLAMDVESPDGSAAVHLRGIVEHSSMVTPTSIAFDTRVSRSAWTTGTPGPLTAGGVGWGGTGAGSFFGTYFDLDGPALATLSIDVRVPNSYFSVYFSSVDAFGGKPLWTEIVRPSSPETSFARALTLPLVPGTYEIYAEYNDFLSLGAAGYEDRAGFSLVLAPLAPIPEPATWALTLAGLAIVALGARLRRPCSKPASTSSGALGLVR